MMLGVVNDQPQSQTKAVSFTPVPALNVRRGAKSFQNHEGTALVQVGFCHLWVTVQE